MRAGMGVEQDLSEAVRLYRLSALQGNSRVLPASLGGSQGCRGLHRRGG